MEKAMIWMGCIFCFSLVTVFARNSGIILGAIPTTLLFAGMCWLARTLCEKWDPQDKQTTETEHKEGE